jgi:hypothetical protein
MKVNPGTTWFVRQRCALSIVLAAFVILAGCVDVHLQYKIEDDGSGTLTSNIEILPQGVALGLTIDKLEKELKRRDRAFEAPEVEYRQTFSKWGNPVLVTVVPFKKVSEISSPSLRVSLVKTKNTSKHLFRITDRPGSVPAMIRIRADVEMPGRITQSNADRVEGNVAYFDSVTGSRLLYVESEPSYFDLFNGRSIGAVGIALVGMILVLGVYWHFDRRRPRDDTEESAPSPVRDYIPPDYPEEPFPAEDYEGDFDAGRPSAFCPQCGERVESGTRFCGQCGHALAGAAHSADRR